jgi:bacillolysin
MKARLYWHLTILVGILILLLGMPYLGQAAPPAQGPLPSDYSEKELVNRLKQETDDTVRISYHAETGKVRFIGATPGRSITQPSILGVDATTEEAARGFLATYGKLFGMKDSQNELAVMKERTLDDGRAFVRFQQTYQGVPIVGGELIVQTDLGRDVISANGEVLPDLELDVIPTISDESARQMALAKVAKDYGVSLDSLTTSEPQLWIYNPALLGNPGRRISTLVWRLEVTPVELLPIREFVLVDAQLGFVTLHFNQVDTAKVRTIYDNNNNPSLGLPGTWVRSEGGAATGATEADNAYDYSGFAYDFYDAHHSRNGIDDAGMTMISTVRYCPDATDCPYANAFWNGSQMVYGDGYASADDIVAHELTHAVTSYESGLYYFYQSGAINEAFSDIWGEFVDQSYTNGNDTDTPAVRWLMGEDAPGGPGRSMSNPPAYSLPDTMNSTYYYCGELDDGGVHINMGVGSKAAYLMVAGGSFNGYTVTGLGMSKVADLFYEVQTNMLTSGSNYNDLYDALIQASINLGYSAADQQEVQDAVNAVEMNQRPCSDPPEALICPPGESPTNLFFDDMENTSSGNWASAAIQGVNEWYYPQTANPYGFDATYASSGIYNLWGYNQSATADFYIAMTSDVTLPDNAYMHFKHDWAFEDYGNTKYDGGVLEYSTNGGSNWSDAGLFFSVNGYNGTISTTDTNPLGGRQAFTAEGHGYTASRLDLSGLAGQDVRFRFRIGTDSIVDALGWFVDDVRIYTCPSQFPPPGTIFLPIILKNS